MLIGKSYKKACKNLFPQYIIQNWIVFIVGGYFLLASLLYIYSNSEIDIGIPCIYKLTTGNQCWGCGSSRAFMDLLQLKFVVAWNHNKLIFIVFPSIVYYIVTDFFNFRKTYKQK